MALKACLNPNYKGLFVFNSCISSAQDNAWTCVTQSTFVEGRKCCFEPSLGLHPSTTEPPQAQSQGPSAPLGITVFPIHSPSPSCGALPPRFPSAAQGQAARPRRSCLSMELVGDFCLENTNAILS